MGNPTFVAECHSSQNSPDNLPATDRAHLLVAEEIPQNPPHQAGILTRNIQASAVQPLYVRVLMREEDRHNEERGYWGKEYDIDDGKAGLTSA